MLHLLSDLKKKMPKSTDFISFSSHFSLLLYNKTFSLIGVYSQSLLSSHSFLNNFTRLTSPRYQENPLGKVSPAFTFPNPSVCSQSSCHLTSQQDPALLINTSCSRYYLHLVWGTPLFLNFFLLDRLLLLSLSAVSSSFS